MNDQHDDGKRVTISSGWFYGSLLALLLALTMALDLFFLTGFISSDDSQYYQAVRYLFGLAPAPATPVISDLRMGVILPAAFFLWVTGENIIIQSWCFTLFHAGVVVLTFLLGRALHNRRVGAGGAALAALCPTMVLYAGTILPDIPLTFFIMGGMLAAIAARRREGARAAAWWFVSGLSVGLSYTVKESSLIVLPVFGLAMITPLRGGLWRRLPAAAAAFGLGLALVIGVEMLVLHRIYGKWILRLVLPQGTLSYGEPWPGFNDPFARYRYYYMGMTFYMGRLIPLYMAAVALYPLLRRRSWLLWGMAVWIWVYNLWGSASLTQYIPQYVQPRYFMTCLPLAALCIAALADGAALWVRRSGRRAAWGAMQAALVIGGLFITWESLRVSNENAGTPHYARLSDEMGSAMNHALMSFDQPLLVCAREVEPLFLGRELSPRVFHNPKSLYTREELARMMGRDGLLVLLREDGTDNATDLHDNVTRRIQAAVRGQVDVAAELKLAKYGVNELFNTQFIGFFPSGAGLDWGRLGFFLRSIGWRAARPATPYLGVTKVYLYLVRPNPAAAQAALKYQRTFTLSQALGGGGAETWVEATQGARVARDGTDIVATCEQPLPDNRLTLTLPPGPVDTPPAPVSGQAGFPAVTNAGRQLSVWLRCGANPPAELTLEVIQYDERGRLQPEGMRGELVTKKIKATTTKGQEYFIHTLLEPGTRSIRFRVGMQATPGSTLVIKDMILEQLVM